MSFSRVLEDVKYDINAEANLLTCLDVASCGSLKLVVFIPRAIQIGRPLHMKLV